jgi:hypothetical protein
MENLSFDYMILLNRKCPSLKRMNEARKKSQIGLFPQESLFLQFKQDRKNRQQSTDRQKSCTRSKCKLTKLSLQRVTDRVVQFQVSLQKPP